VTGTDSAGTPTTYVDVPSPTYYSTTGGAKYTTDVVTTPNGYETITYNTVPTAHGYETYVDTTTSRGATVSTTSTDEISYNSSGATVNHITSTDSTGAVDHVTSSTGVTGHGGFVTYYTVETPDRGTSTLTEFTRTVDDQTLTYITGTNTQGEFTDYTQVDGLTPVTTLPPSKSVRTECFLVDSTGEQESQ